MTHSLKGRFFGLLAFAVLLPSAAFAFPANVRHGYPNCTACHVSPGGGGVLSAYGRELSKEIQSTWGTDQEVPFIYGVVKTPEWLDAGGDWRYLQMVTNTPDKVSGRGFWMQGDVEAAAHIANRFTADVTVGWKGNSEALEQNSDIMSRRFFLSYSITDPAASTGQWAVRAGKFYPVFGIMPAEHEYQTRKSIGFDENQESYNLELSYMDEKGSLFVSPIFGKGHDETDSDERGFSVSKYFTVLGNSRVGGSFLYGKGIRTTDYDHRFVMGPNWIVSFSKPLFWVGELDYEFRVPGASQAKTDRALYFTHKFTYEPLQGLQFSILQDYGKSNVVDSNTQAWSIGPVVDFYPRPHFDFQVAANRMIMPANLSDIWVYTGLFHFYL